MNFYKYIPKKVMDKQLLQVDLTVNFPHGRCCLPFNKLQEKPENIYFIIPKSLKLLTIQDFIPSEAPTESANFLTVNRYKDTVRLAGVRCRGAAAASLKENIDDFFKLLSQEGVVLDFLLASSAIFPFIMQHSDIRVIEEPSLDDNEIYAITANTWVLYETESGEPWQLVCNNPGRNGVLTI